MVAQLNGASAVIWRKSSASSGTGNCVEIAKSGPFVLVRDSRNRSGPMLAITGQQWLGLLERIRNAAG